MWTNALKSFLQGICWMNSWNFKSKRQNCIECYQYHWSRTYILIESRSENRAFVQKSIAIYHFLQVQGLTCSVDNEILKGFWIFLTFVTLVQVARIWNLHENLIRFALLKNLNWIELIILIKRWFCSGSFWFECQQIVIKQLSEFSFAT